METKASIYETEKPPEYDQIALVQGNLHMDEDIRPLEVTNMEHLILHVS